MRKILFLLLIFGVLININLVDAQLTQGLRAYWSFNETSGTNATDIIRNFNITVNRTNAQGVFGTNALQFNSTFTANGANTQYVTNVSNMTINFWLNKTDSLTTNGLLNNIFTGNSPSINGEFRLTGTGGANSSADANNQMLLDIMDSSTRYLIALPINLTSGPYRMITFTFNTSQVSFYVDGIINASYVLNNFILAPNNLTLFTDSGGTSPSTLRNARLDEFGIWNRTLNSTEVNLLRLGNYPFSNLPPVITTTLNSPVSGSILNQESIPFNASYIATSSNLTNASYYIWRNNGTIFNLTSLLVNGTSNSTSLLVSNFNSGNYLWNVYACGINNTATICDWADSNFTFSWRPFNLLNQSYNNPVYETSRQLFRLNLTTLSSVLSVDSNLIYNNISYDAFTNCVSGLCNINTSIDIPLVRAGDQSNYSFYWTINVFDGEEFIQFNTTENSQNQSVNKINLRSCDASITNKVINFTAYDEVTISNKLSNWSFAGSFNYWLGSGSVYQNYSLYNQSVDEVDICTQPGNETIYHTSQVDYSKMGYVSRDYYFQNATLINTNLQHIPLILLNSSDSTSFILKVLAENLNGIPNALIYIQKYYPGEDLFRTVQVAKTDDNGNSIGFYQTETVDYKHIIVSNGTVIISTNSGKIFGETVPFTLQFQIGQSSETPWTNFEDLPNLVYNISYDSNSSLVSFSYIDTSGNILSARLNVEEEQYSGPPTTLCNTTSLIASATITCNVSSAENALVARAYITRETTIGERLVDILNIIIDNAREVFGRFGLFGAILIILLSYLATIRNISASLVTGWVVTLLMNMTPLLNMPPLYIFAHLGITVIALVAVNKR